jgi:hypothetical protein
MLLLALYFHELGGAKELFLQHTSAYVRIHQHTSAFVSIRQHTSAYVCIRLHTSAYVCIRAGRRERAFPAAYVSIRQHTSAYISVRQHTSAYVSIRQHTSSSCQLWRRTMILMLSLVVSATGVCGLKLLVYEALSY